VTSLRLWCEHAWLGGSGTSEGVLIEVDEDRITQVTSGIAGPPAGAATLPGVTIPGLVNGFADLTQRALRGRVTGTTRASWATAAAELTNALDLERFSHLAEAVLAEMSLSGFTTVGAVIPRIAGVDAVRVLRVVIDAAERAGVRVTGLVSAPTFGDVDGSAVQAWGTSLFDTVEHLRSHPHARAATLVADISRSSMESLKAVTKWTGNVGIPMAVRVSADIESHEAAKEVHSMTGMEVLAEVGALTNRGGFTAVHAVEATASDAALLGQNRGLFCATPTGDRELGSGVISIDAMRVSGARVTIGSSSGAVIDPFAELRALEGHARLASGRRLVMTPTELLRAATADATVSLGWRDAGLLASGQRADLVTISLESHRMAGADPEDLLSAILTSASPTDITHVAVGGSLVAQGGRHKAGDIAAKLRYALAAIN
jgi:cytosine/adenosine deaminase-related metal-dependent hydrolase